MADRKDILFVHNNFPAQFGFIATALKQRGYRCVAIGSNTARSTEIPVRQWKLGRGSGKDIFNLATRAEADLLRARAAAEPALALKERGFDPQLIIGHPGWGETLFLDPIFPDARQILHGELYYRPTGYDSGFDREFDRPTQEDAFRIFAKNAGMAMAYLQADRIVSPTRFQASSFPDALQPLLKVVHEGVDVDRIKPNRAVKLKIKDGPTLDASTPVITFVNRNMEPLRGFHIFMRALPELLAAVPNAQVVIIGNYRDRGYGGAVQGADTWQEKLLLEVGDRIDRSRVHFVGRVPHDWMHDALRISAAHVYYTYPFVLSWSLLEAMALECLVLASDTEPVREVVRDGVNGRMLDFFDVPALSRAMIEACERPQDFQHLRRAARETVVGAYDRERQCKPAWLALIDEQLALA